MKILVDTNVILDVLLRRRPFYGDSRAVYELVEQCVCAGCISSSAATDIFYIARRQIKNTGVVYKIMDVLCADFTIAPVFERTIKGALSLRWKDFEDAVQYVTARENEADYIVTRNAGDYTTAARLSLGAPFCVSPTDFLSRFTEQR